MTAYETWVLYILTGLLGLCIGSFLNVVIYRVPEKMSLAKPASHCPHCQYRLRWYDNIPLVSYILLGGKCRKCREKISLRYPAIELINTLLWLLSVYMFWEKSIPYACVAAAISSVSLCIFCIDWDKMVILDRFQFLFAALGLAAMFLEPDPDITILSHLIGAAAGAISFWMIGALASKISGKEALGFGDVKLAACMGLFLGWQKLLMAVLIASVGGSIILFILRKCRGHEQGREYPFAPFLMTGFLITLFFGTPVMQWYLSLLYL